MGVKEFHPFWITLPPFDKHYMHDIILFHPYEVWATRALHTKYSMLSIYLHNFLLQFLHVLLRVSLAFHALTHIVSIFHMHLACISSLQLNDSLLL